MVLHVHLIAELVDLVDGYASFVMVILVTGPASQSRRESLSDILNAAFVIVVAMGSSRWALSSTYDFVGAAIVIVAFSGLILREVLELDNTARHPYSLPPLIHQPVTLPLPSATITLQVRFLIPQRHRVLHPHHWQHLVIIASEKHAPCTFRRRI